MMQSITSTSAAMKVSIHKVSKDMTAGEFLKLVKTNPASIKRSSIKPLRLGSSGFGKIHVEFK
jgi:hypothetical protein